MNRGIKIKTYIFILLNTILLSQSIPYFDEARAFEYIIKQCDMGPRYPGSVGHDNMKEFLIETLESKSDSIIVYNHKIRHPYEDKEIILTNVLSRFNVDAQFRIMVMAHWDTREIADKDPIIENRDKPILGANDGASGVSILLELANILSTNKLKNIGIDLLFIDGEDMGRNGELENFCIGSTMFCEVIPNPQPLYAICLDMVADKDPSFPIEYFSYQQAPFLVKEIWSLAANLGYKEFEQRVVGPIYDDHRALYINSGIPAIDIIDFDYPYWHTLDDTPENCSSHTLKIVGNIMTEYIYLKDYEIK